MKNIAGIPSSHRQQFEHPRDQIIQVIERIYQYRMTTTSGGNISIRDSNGDIWITPAHVDKGTLRREDVVCVHPNGKSEGLHPPSSEIPFHRALYAARPDLHAIVHAHPVALVASSLVWIAPETRLLCPVYDVCGDVGVAKYAMTGRAELGRQIAKPFRKGYDCALLENHGVVVGGCDLAQAFQRFETLEFAVKITIKGRQLGEIHYLTQAQLDLAHAAVRPGPVFKRPALSPSELELRKQLVQFVRRGYRQRLFISTGGSFSARLDANTFLITPHGFDRQSIDVDDLVLVRGNAVEAGRPPSHAYRVHAAIYKQHPEVQSILNAYTVNATAFGVTHTPLDSRMIPESYVFLRSVGQLAYGPQFTNPAMVARAISLEKPCLLLGNDGALVCGTSVLNAFDRLEVLESTAEAVINARHLGSIAPMNEKAIRDLDRAFFQTPEA